MSALIRDGKLVSTALGPDPQLSKLNKSQELTFRQVMTKSNAGELNGADAHAVLELRKAFAK